MTSDQETTTNLSKNTGSADPSAAVEWPIVYHDGYNMSFWGTEKFVWFDSSKWKNICQFLIDGKMIESGSCKIPEAVNDDVLKTVHSQRYLDSLKWSVNVARITAMLPVALMPNSIVQRKVLTPMRLQTGGSIMAGKLAVQHGWALNVGGGLHHCSSEKGGGSCPFADITLLIKHVMMEFDQIKKVMIIDLDAHQGNGHERDFMEDESVYILDMYNRNIYPHDEFAKKNIKK